MGLIGRVLNARGGVVEAGKAVGGVAEIFVGNRAAREAAEHAQVLASLQQYGAEFAQPKSSWFDRFMDGLNRFPRPLLVIGTIGLFAYAMAEPTGFARRMEGLALVPDPMWWLLGAIVSFYFGSRELHYQRGSGQPAVVVLPPIGEAGEPTVADDLVPASVPPNASIGERFEPAGSAQGEAAGNEDDTNAGREAGGSDLAPATSPPAPGMAIRASDPQFNAAIEEWRAGRS